MSALIFDCDGVLVDSEGSLHLTAFNRMWEEAQVPWHWTAGEYAQLTRISGGRERLASLHADPRFRSAVPVPEDKHAWTELVAEWHRRKTEIYVDLLGRADSPARSGVRRLVKDALSSGWRVGVASSGAHRSVSAVVRCVMGEDMAEKIVVVAGDHIHRKKPAPDIYLEAARILECHPARCVVIEDTQNGLRAARSAGMRCVVTPTEMNRQASFPGAAMIVSCLGDPDGEHFTSASFCSDTYRSWVTLEDLSALLSMPMEDAHAAM